MSFPFNDIELNEVHKTTRAWHRFEDTAALAAHEASDMSLAHISVLDEARYFALARMLGDDAAARSPALLLIGRARVDPDAIRAAFAEAALATTCSDRGRMAAAAETCNRGERWSPSSN